MNRPDAVQERHFVVGQHCAVRVQLYHGLWHYKHRMQAKLKKELKKAKAHLQVRLAPFLAGQQRPPHMASQIPFM